MQAGKGAGLQATPALEQPLPIASPPRSLALRDEECPRPHCGLAAGKEPQTAQENTKGYAWGECGGGDVGTGSPHAMPSESTSWAMEVETRAAAASSCISSHHACSRGRL
eukprot:CAMPEP_0183335218 /NCGR_PEP_ID=MMETSP0164_2-20130417/3592_1 /TAXON_ID=221442 /ORGANISM="Coccolithus pelagicus ssp braarudi, Strain PLY182g" /LENGTH=109 /DNA_ID=CAMNT_0025504541 /DNA_START=251 /DNA_END=579 /DNA_ORIENTATION=+